MADLAALQTATDQLVADQAKFHAVIHGNAAATVAVDGGVVPSLMNAIVSLMATWPAKPYTTVASLPGGTDAAVAMVTADTTPANNGFYYKVGGTSTWVKIADGTVFTGRNVELQVAGGFVQWRPVNTATWFNLIALTAITGPQGPTGPTGLTGPAGGKVFLSAFSGNLHWRHEGVAEWTVLTSLASITGPQGGVGPQGIQGPQGKLIYVERRGDALQYRYEGSSDWIDIVSLDDIRGPSVELRATESHIQWKGTNHLDWSNLISLSQIKGKDGRDAILESTGDGIYWRYEGENELRLLLTVDQLRGRSIELRRFEDTVQWRVNAAGAEWYQLFTTDIIRGPAGRELELRKSATHVEWRYSDETTWTKMIALDDIRGNAEEVETNPAFPGENPKLYTTVLGIADPTLAPRIPAHQIRVSDRKSVLTRTGEGRFVRAKMLPVEQGHRYMVRFKVQRTVNTSDPAEDAVRLGVAQYDKFKNSYLNNIISIEDVPLTVAMGAVERMAVVSKGIAVGVSGVTHALDAKTEYVQLFTEQWGTTQTSEVEIMDWVDLTLMEEYSVPDLAALTARVLAVETLNIGPTLAALAAVTSGMNVSVYATRVDAMIGPIPLSVDVIRTYGHTFIGDGGDAVYERAAAANLGGFTAADGSFWKNISPHYTPQMFGCFPGPYVDDAKAQANSVGINAATVASVGDKKALKIEFHADGYSMGAPWFWIDKLVVQNDIHNVLWRDYDQTGTTGALVRQADFLTPIEVHSQHITVQARRFVEGGVERGRAGTMFALYLKNSRFLYPTVLEWWRNAASGARAFDVVYDSCTVINPTFLNPGAPEGFDVGVGGHRLLGGFDTIIHGLKGKSFDDLEQFVAAGTPGSTWFDMPFSDVWYVNGQGISTHGRRGIISVQEAATNDIVRCGWLNFSGGHGNGGILIENRSTYAYAVDIYRSDGIARLYLRQGTIRSVRPFLLGEVLKVTGASDNSFNREYTVASIRETVLPRTTLVINATAGTITISDAVAVIDNLDGYDNTGLPQLFSVGDYVTVLETPVGGLELVDSDNHGIVFKVTGVTSTVLTVVPVTPDPSYEMVNETISSGTISPMVMFTAVDTGPAGSSINEAHIQRANPPQFRDCMAIGYLDGIIDHGTQQIYVRGLGTCHIDVVVANTNGKVLKVEGESSGMPGKAWNIIQLHRSRDSDAVAADILNAIDLEIGGLFRGTQGNNVIRITEFAPNRELALASMSSRTLADGVKISAKVEDVGADRYAYQIADAARVQLYEPRMKEAADLALRGGGIHIGRVHQVDIIRPDFSYLPRRDVTPALTRTNQLFVENLTEVEAANFPQIVRIIDPIGLINPSGGQSGAVPATSPGNSGTTRYHSTVDDVIYRLFTLKRFPTDMLIAVTGGDVSQIKVNGTEAAGYTGMNIVAVNSPWYGTLRAGSELTILYPDANPPNIRFCPDIPLDLFAPGIQYGALVPPASGNITVDDAVGLTANWVDSEGAYGYLVTVTPAGLSDPVISRRIEYTALTVNPFDLGTLGWGKWNEATVKVASYNSSGTATPEVLSLSDAYVPGAVGWWAFDLDWPFHYNDQSTNPHPLVSTGKGAVVFDDIHGYCYEQTDEGDYLDPVGMDYPTGPWTIAFWAKPLNITAAQNRTIFSGDTGTNLNIRHTAGSWVVRMNNTTYLTAVGAAAGVWVHVAVTWDGAGTLRMYLNGSNTPASEATGIASGIPAASSVRIGSNNAVQSFLGRLKHLTIFDRVLPNNQINIIKNWYPEFAAPTAHLTTEVRGKDVFASYQSRRHRITFEPYVIHENAAIIGGNKLEYDRRPLPEAVTYYSPSDLTNVNTRDLDQGFTTPLASNLDAATYAKFSHLAMDGQSLSVGRAAIPVIVGHDTALSSTRFASFELGPRILGEGAPSWLKKIADLDTMDAQIAYREYQIPSTGTGRDGETSGYQLLSYIASTLAANEAVLVTNPSIGGKSIMSLSRGAPLENKHKAILMAYMHAISKGVVYENLGVVWSQGGADNNLPIYGTDKTVTLDADGNPRMLGYGYTNFMWDYWNQYKHIVSKITGQRSFTRSRMYVTQVAHSSTSLVKVSNSPLAQLQAARDDTASANIICCGPEYICPVAWEDFGDRIHMNEVGQAIKGAMVGKYMKKVLTGASAAALKPLHITAAVRVGNTITCTIHNPDGSALALDTTWVTDPALTLGVDGVSTPYADRKYGLRYTYTGGTPGIVVSGVSFPNATTMTVTLTGNPGTVTNEKLGVADSWNETATQWNPTNLSAAGPKYGPRCCIRNTSVETISITEDRTNWTNPDQVGGETIDLVYPLHDYLCVQQVNVTV